MFDPQPKEFGQVFCILGHILRTTFPPTVPMEINGSCQIFSKRSINLYYTLFFLDWASAYLDIRITEMYINMNVCLFFAFLCHSSDYNEIFMYQIPMVTEKRKTCKDKLERISPRGVDNFHGNGKYMYSSKRT